jgi:class 3 adenylate cyclase
LGDQRWRDLLATHYAVVRRELTRFKGREVKTVGDGFLATFDGPARAIRCACAIRDGVRTLGIEIRAGLHTGECELMGDDVGGIAVHIGLEWRRVPGSGEVLVSAPSRTSSRARAYASRIVVRTTLHGVPGEWRLFVR